MKKIEGCLGKVMQEIVIRISAGIRAHLIKKYGILKFSIIQIINDPAFPGIKLTGSSRRSRASKG